MKDYYPTRMHMKVRLYKEEPSFGKGVVMLLEGIEQFGSISLACSNMKMANSKAWKILKRAQEDLNVQLVVSEAGGKKGGHSILTDEAKDLIQRYHLMMDEIDQASKKAFERYFG